MAQKSEKNTEEIDQKKKNWQQHKYDKTCEKFSLRKKKFENLSNMELSALYTPDDIKKFQYLEKLGFPGQYPFTRGVYPTMHRGRLWTMRQFAGLGNAEDTNKRFKYLINEGQTGLSVAFHLPTIYGHDSDSSMSIGEVGKEGVAIDTLADMERLFEGIDLRKISTSMTINAPAAVLLCMYIAVGENQGVPSEELTGTIQNDILKEYQAQKSYVFPPEPSMRLIVDTIEYCTKYIPKWNTISISGYHIREAGSTAVQELAFTLGNGLAYVEAGIERGLDVDDFAPRLSFFFNAHNNFFEEIAKYRAARRIWAKYMKQKYGAKKEASMRCRFHTQTAGVSLTAQEPYNNVVRVALQGMAAVLGGTQSLHTNSFDEALALPSEDAVRISLRTQQIIAHESGAADVIDPLGGSYYIEKLTDIMEEKAEEYFEQVRQMGNGSMLKGTIAGIKNNFFQREISDSAYQFQRELEAKKQVQVGVNKFTSPTESKIKPEILKISDEVAEKQIEFLHKVKRGRDDKKAQECLQRIKETAQGEKNLIPHILEAVKAYCSNGEIVNALRDVWGEYKEDSIF